MTTILAPAPHLATRPAVPTRWPGTDGPRARHASSRNIIAIWSERMRFRWDLQHMLSANPHLIDDIGLTKRQVEAEVAKPFWQA